METTAKINAEMDLAISLCVVGKNE